MIRTVVSIAVLLVVMAAAAARCFSQANPDLQTYFKEYIGLSDDQIAAIRGGQAIAKTLHSRTPDEVFVFGAIHIKAAPKATSSFRVISTAFASFPDTWQLLSSTILHSFPT